MVRSHKAAGTLDQAISDVLSGPGGRVRERSRIHDHDRAAPQPAAAALSKPRADPPLAKTLQVETPPPAPGGEVATDGAEPREQDAGSGAAEGGGTVVVGGVAMSADAIRLLGEDKIFEL